MRLKIGYIIVSALLFAGCSPIYHSLSLETLSYIKGDSSKGIVYGYRFDVLKEFGNKKYFEKEVQNNIRLVAFSITNLSSTNFSLVDDLEYIQYGSRQIKPLETQKVYSLFEITTGMDNYELNLTMAKLLRSNHALRIDLDRYTPYATISPHETKLVLIGFEDISARPIQIQFKRK